MISLKGIKPEFWDIGNDAGPSKGLFNYRRIWRMAIALLAVVALVPLIVMTFIDYNVTRNSMTSENMLRTARTTSNTRRSLAYFFTEHKNALEYIVRRENVHYLKDNDRLKSVLTSLQKSFGGFVDLGLIDGQGHQVAYVGPYQLEGRNYADQEWFTKTLEHGVYTSSVFLGYRDVPHMIVALRYPDAKHGKNFVLRATLDTGQFNSILSSLDIAGSGDAFVVDRNGVLQTPSRWHGKVLSKIELPIPSFSEKTRVFSGRDHGGEEVTVGYAYIENTPFVLIIVKKNKEIMASWQSIRMELLWLLAISIAVILVVIVGVATYMVDKIYVADQTRAKALHHIEHTNRMASIGRLAAGVAHEINNPLAIINEKAGLVKDLFQFKAEYKNDERLLKNIDSIINSVNRCGTITKRLLGFARHIDVKIEPIRFKELSEEVMGFLHKEAEYRSIHVEKDIPDELPQFKSDRGKLQQILLNLVNNAFQAMNDGGHLTLSARKLDNSHLEFSVKDDGCGIPEADRKRIFEPFFSTKKKKGGTGLGLSITYGLVQELGGSMSVRSEVGKGTEFTIALPLAPTIKEADHNENTAC